MKIGEGTSVVARGEGGLISKKYAELKPFEHFAFKSGADKVSVAKKGLVHDEIQFTEEDWGEVFDYLLKQEEV